MKNTRTNASGKIFDQLNFKRRLSAQQINGMHFCCENSEWLFRNATDYIVSGGYKEAGYEYVIIDDCWMEMERDPKTQELVPDRKRFPSGLKALADYVCIKIAKYISLQF